MSAKIRTCQDGHRCENGSSCAEHPTEEGKYYCDCGTSGGDFAGLFCEYEAETYCQLQQETTSDWFCSNQGTCVLSTGKKAQWNCDCPADFEGPHCQFVAGNVPKDWPGYDFDPVASSARNNNSKNTKSSGEGGIHIAVSIFIGLAVAVVLALVGFFVVRKIRNQDIGDATQNSTRDHSEAVNKLDADGSVLQGALAQFARTPNSTIQHDLHDAVSAANRSPDDHSVEVGFYSDKRHGSRSAGRDIL